MPMRSPTFKPRFEAPAKSNDLVRGTARERGYDGSWRRVRLAKLQSNPICEIQSESCTVSASLVDHRIPLTAGGDRLGWDNLRSACCNCHALVTQNFKETGTNELLTDVAVGAETEI